MDSSGSAGAQWEEPEFEFDDIGIDLAAAARHSSGKVTEHVLLTLITDVVLCDVLRFKF